MASCLRKTDIALMLALLLPISTHAEQRASRSLKSRFACISMNRQRMLIFMGATVGSAERMLERPCRGPAG